MINGNLFAPGMLPYAEAAIFALSGLGTGVLFLLAGLAAPGTILVMLSILLVAIAAMSVRFGKGDPPLARFDPAAGLPSLILCGYAVCVFAILFAGWLSFSESGQAFGFAQICCAAASLGLGWSGYFFLSPSFARKRWKVLEDRYAGRRERLLAERDRENREDSGRDH